MCVCMLLWPVAVFYSVLGGLSGRCCMKTDPQYSALSVNLSCVCVCVCVCVVSRRLCLTLNTVFCEVWLLTFLTFTALKTTRIWFSSISRHVEKWRAAVCVAGLTFWCLTGSLQLLEISWNLKSNLEILEICWNLVGPPGNCFANEWQQS